MKNLLWDFTTTDVRACGAAAGPVSLGVGAAYVQCAGGARTITMVEGPPRALTCGELKATGMGFCA